MNNTAGTAALKKKPYSTPTLTVRSLSFLAELAWRRSADRGRGNPGLRAEETNVQTLIVSGFEQDFGNAIRAVSSAGRGARAIPERDLAGMEALQERAKIAAHDGVSVLLADMRGAASATPQPVTRIELNEGPRATIILALTDAGQNASGTAEVQRPGYWRILGPVTADALRLVIHSLLQVSSSPGEPPRSMAGA